MNTDQIAEEVVSKFCAPGQCGQTMGHAGRDYLRDIIKAAIKQEREAHGITRHDLIEANHKLNDARRIIERAVDLMTTQQVSKWEGVRSWLEQMVP